MDRKSTPAHRFSPIVHARSHAVRALPLTILSIVVLAGLVVARAAALSPDQRSIMGAGPAPEPADRLSSAADQLEAATAPGSTGYSFEIVQTSTITARSGGPRIEIPDPLDPSKSLGFADEYLFYSLIERGIVTPDGFYPHKSRPRWEPNRSLHLERLADGTVQAGRHGDES